MKPYQFALILHFIWLAIAWFTPYEDPRIIVAGTYSFVAGMAALGLYITK